ncbi:AAA family ATPase [Rummeliibacillus pycnus]|uniref:AAA family ATPase n=1 Tax=Rummeliibacillus pycnus TaxID=101070 RepID=UPI0037CBE062
MAKLIIVSGYNSVGKTTVGKALAKELGAVFIDSPKTTDVLMEEIINAYDISGTDFATVMKVRQMTELQVQALRQLIRDQLELGLDVVLEVSTYYSDAHFVEVGEPNVTNIHHVEISIPNVEEEKRRFMFHHPEAYLQYEKDWESYVAKRLPVYTDADLFEQNIVIVFDNTSPLTEVTLKQLVNQVE